MIAKEQRALAHGSIRHRRSLGYELARFAFMIFMRLFGWRVEGAMPSDRKMVILAAPHRSNWDLMFMLGSAFYYRVPVHWLGKKSLVEGPFGWVMRWWGCLPVDRSQSTSIVEQVAAAYAARDEMAVVVAPEGTRANVSEWKTGFYMIARAAQVPISFGYLNYQRKVGGIGGSIHPTGDYVSDMDEILQYYSDHVPDFRSPTGIQPIKD